MMYSIYQFGFKVYDDPTKWQEQIKNLFDLDFKINVIINEYPNIEKNWIESISPSLYQLEGFQLFEEYVEIVHASFNRYQSYVYLTLVFKGDVTNNSSFIKKLQEKFGSYVSGFVDNFAIPFKESEGEAEKSKYNEFLDFENPVLVIDDFSDNTYLKAKVKSGDLYYKFDYNGVSI